MNPTQLTDGTFVIFGITGDLAKRKLLPALYELTEMNLLSERFRIVGTSRRNTQIEDILVAIRESLANKGISPNENTLEKLQSIIRIVHMDITNPNDYTRLKHALDMTEDEVGLCVNRLFYLAVPPEIFNTIVSNLGNNELHLGCQHRIAESRLLIEKPFGYDTQSATELIAQIEAVFPEDLVYRVDHYLAKETAQNIMTFRFDNPVFRAIWDKSAVDHIIISASETLGIEGRSNFYERTGALRDLIQSHLLQLLALICMEEPVSKSATDIHKAKLNLLNSVKPADPSKAKRGQYQSYAAEVGNPDSSTETFASLQLAIQNDRWMNTPIYIQSGKALAKKETVITLIFKAHDESDHVNKLEIRIQPDEGIVLHFLAKKPSLQDETEPVSMEFHYGKSFSGQQPDAYERVLVDAIRGDKTLFTTSEEVISSWRIVEPIINEWQIGSDGLILYPHGSSGPVIS